MIEVEKVARVLGGKKILGRDIRSLLDLEETVSEGLPTKSLEHCLDAIYTSAPRKRGIMYMVVPRATWRRRLRKQILKAGESEKTERLARVIATARQVWDDDDDAREFLDTPHPELAGKRPIHAAMTELGARHVEDILWSITYGLPA